MPNLTTHDRTTLFYRRWGEGPPVVFCHGWAVNSEMWQPQMYALAKAGFQAVAYDRRGHGRSDDAGGGYDYDTLADDLGALLETLDLRDATLVGHSMGNGEITRYVTRHGAGRVGRIVMVAPSIPYPLKGPGNPDGNVDPVQAVEWRALWATQFTEWLAQAAPTAYPPDVPQDRLQQTIRMMLQASLQAVIECNVTNTDTDFRGELAALAVPTLILHGDADTSAPLEATGRRVAALVKGSRLKVYPGARHTIIGSHVPEIVAEIIGFAKVAAPELVG